MTSLTLPPTGLRFENIDKRYGGLFALRRLSVEISPGECLVLAGRNGSGKTTLLRIAARIVRPTAGKLSFPGASAEPDTAGRPGYVAHTTMVYDELTAEENLVLFAKLQDVPQPAARAEELLGEVGLYDRRPSALLFDEPATGLDPIGISWLAKTLGDVHRSGCTVVMSLHGESEISALATRASQLDAGSVAADTNSGASLRSILSFGGA